MASSVLEFSPIFYNKHVLMIFRKCYLNEIIRQTCINDLQEMLFK